MNTLWLSTIFLLSGAAFSAGFGMPAAPASAGTVYLTFDADMTPRMAAALRGAEVAGWYDPALIDLMEKERLPATVFVTGLFAETYPDLIRRLASDGISVQNHSYDHPAFAGRCYGLRPVRSGEERLAQIERTQDLLERLSGRRPRLFRFPGLCHSSEDTEWVAGMGLSVVDGDVVSGDAFSSEPREIVRRVMSGVRDGSIIVMHLGGPNAPSTAAAVRELIPLLRQKGFALGSL
jgi:peptidoglycan-N-acetylglucosamine deacetylase